MNFDFEILNILIRVDYLVSRSGKEYIFQS